MKKVERWKMEMPTEQEMLPKDKYTVFDRKVKRYRKGIHSRWCILELGARGLISYRGAKVDEGQPKTQSPGFLAHHSNVEESQLCVYFCVIISFASDMALKRGRQCIIFQNHLLQS